VSAWLLEFANAEDLRGLVRLEVREGQPHASFWTFLTGLPGHAGIVAVRDDEVPPPRQGLQLRGDGIWAELMCETPREHWTFGLEAFGIRVDNLTDEMGDRIPVGLDLEWEVSAAGPPAGTVHGDVLVGRDRFGVDGEGTFFEGDAPAPDEGLPERWLARSR
jgi:hypothetical protein